MYIIAYSCIHLYTIVFFFNTACAEEIQRWNTPLFQMKNSEQLLQWYRMESVNTWKIQKWFLNLEQHRRFWLHCGDSFVPIWHQFQNHITCYCGYTIASTIQQKIKLVKTLLVSAPTSRKYMKPIQIGFLLIRNKVVSCYQTPPIKPIEY